MFLFSSLQNRYSKAWAFWFVAGGFLAQQASALDLEWKGQFRAEHAWISDYNFGNGAGYDATRGAANGYYIPGGGSESANFQSLFLRLKPRLIVNDNISIKSEWWAGNPIYGMFGDAAPAGTDQRFFNSTYSRGSFISAQRFWADLNTDFGTLQIGRLPLQYGLGLVWSAGDGLWDRYQSTGDSVRLVGKFGSFSFIPSITKYSAGNSIGGGCAYAGGTCPPLLGGGGVQDYSLIFKYENVDEEFEGGVNFIKRLGGSAQDPTSGFYGVVGTAGVYQSVALNYNTWDIYARKKIGKFTFAAEVPIISGSVGGVDYKTVAAATELKYEPTDSWLLFTKIGTAPGQPGTTTGNASTYRAFYFHPNYKVGMFMFNYQFANFAGPNNLNNPNANSGNLKSPYDNPIVNANYINWGAEYKLEKWSFRGNFVYAEAREMARRGQAFYNTWQRRYVNNNQGDQRKQLGWEMSYGTTFRWDENFVAMFDFGWYFPGSYYRFSNDPGKQNNTDEVFGTLARVGIDF